MTYGKQSIIETLQSRFTQSSKALAERALTGMLKAHQYCANGGLTLEMSAPCPDSSLACRTPPVRSVRMGNQRRVVFAYFDGCEVLDFAGPLQAFHEARSLGAPLAIVHCGPAASARTAQGLMVTDLSPPPSLSRPIGDGEA